MVKSRDQQVHQAKKRTRESKAILLSNMNGKIQPYTKTVKIEVASVFNFIHLSFRQNTSVYLKSIDLLIIIEIVLKTVVHPEVCKCVSPHLSCCG